MNPFYFRGKGMHTLNWAMHVFIELGTQNNTKGNVLITYIRVLVCWCYLFLWLLSSAPAIYPRWCTRLMIIFCTWVALLMTDLLPISLSTSLSPTLWRMLTFIKFITSFGWGRFLVWLRSLCSLLPYARESWLLWFVSSSLQDWMVRVVFVSTTHTEWRDGTLVWTEG